MKGEKVNEISTGGDSSFPFIPVLQVILVILKLVEMIEWPWWLVLLPSLIGVALVLLVFVGMFVCTFHDEVKKL